ncbi:hypothetical protein AB834_03500 [PVC group bacterium (ex Bugula neritina AB1)]|nr:hypothetical protein AB834_03500 [PVC group bacterium (ex Bugula neritina AB1)]
MSKIKFGTDGWRAVISDTFTMENVEYVAQAIADTLILKDSSLGQKIVIGYDTRFMSEDYARRIAEVFAANDFKVILSDKVAPTPVVSFLVKHHKATGGIVVTASHNPYRFNGIKFKGAHGGPASSELTVEFESMIQKNSVKKIELAKALESEKIVLEDFDETYFLAVEKYVDMEKIRKSTWSVAVDSMCGAGGLYFQNLIGSEFKGSIETINHDFNPSFKGVNPEPIESNLGKLVKMCSTNFDLGLATDGDADRLGVIDERGNFVSSHQLLSLFFLYFVECRSWTGDVAKSVSTTQLIEVVVKDKGLNVFETPIGFKYISKLMCEKDILIGGEESGGIGFKNHVPERDGLLAGLLVLEIMSHYQKPLSEIVASMEKRYGKYYYKRKDIHYDSADLEKNLEKVKSLKEEFLIGQKTKIFNLNDGVKHTLEDGSWLLMRCSGTEPVLRVYAESADPVKVDKLLKEGEKLVLG